MEVAASTTLEADHPAGELASLELHVLAVVPAVPSVLDHDLVVDVHARAVVRRQAECVVPRLLHLHRPPKVPGDVVVRQARELLHEPPDRGDVHFGDLLASLLREPLHRTHVEKVAKVVGGRAHREAPLGRWEDELVVHALAGELRHHLEVVAARVGAAVVGLDGAARGARVASHEDVMQPPVHHLVAAAVAVAVVAIVVHRARAIHPHHAPVDRGRAERVGARPEDAHLAVEGVGIVGSRDQSGELRFELVVPEHLHPLRQLAADQRHAAAVHVRHRVELPRSLVHVHAPLGLELRARGRLDPGNSAEDALHLGSVRPLVEELGVGVVVHLALDQHLVLSGVERHGACPPAEVVVPVVVRHERFVDVEERAVLRVGEELVGPRARDVDIEEKLVHEVGEGHVLHARLVVTDVLEVRELHLALADEVERASERHPGVERLCVGREDAEGHLG
mmetsp:Transcript_9696/g.21584  ORF Transcript_9696/g.21584 Transcript_9696/m.21584 type:complete len:452 (-) Transcript_9696:2544-3899(-)